MEFDGKKLIVEDVQTILGIKSDGVAGDITWRNIEKQITGNNLGTDNSTRIKNIQKNLKLKEDGIDGKNTWETILKFLSDKNNKNKSQPVKNKGKFNEVVKLTKQTSGQYSQKIIPKAIVLHHTSGNYEGSVEWTGRLFDDNGKRLYACYHCIIARDGRRTITNEDDNRAYHAGISSFKGKSGLNSWSLGVSWERDTYDEALSDAAIESALEYILPRMVKWNISPDMVTDHRTVAPNRKTDIAPKEFDKFMKILKERWEKLK